MKKRGNKCVMAYCPFWGRNLNFFSERLGDQIMGGTSIVFKKIPKKIKNK